jgi:hypothetical protein
MAQGVKTHTNTGAGTTIAIDLAADTYAVGDTELHLDGLDVAFAVGDQFTIAGDNQVYTVTVAGALETADQDVTIYPALKVKPDNDDVVTPSAAYAANLVFHENAFAFVTRPLAAPAGVDSYVTSYDGITLRVVRGYDMKYKKEMLSMDILYGYKTMYPELAVRVLG